MINILTLNELKELVELTEREDTTWTRWINQATNDVDNLCNGFVLKTFESTTDEYRITKLKYAIANTVEGYDQNARLFGKSGTTTGGGDAPFSLTTQSDNSAIEYKRQDIIKSLVSGGWYKNLAMDLQTPLKDELTNDETTKLVEFLSGLFLRTDGTNEYLGDILNFANGGDIVNSGNIVAVDDGFEKTITGYTFEPSADSIINKANMIYDPADAEYKLIDKVDKIAFFGKELNKALTRQETYNLLSASNTLWNAAYSYEEDVAVLYTFTKGGKEFIGQAISLIDNNTGHNPADGGAFWKLYESTGTTDITEIVDKVIEQVEPTIDNQITTGIDDGLKALPTVNYVSEFAKQTISFDTEADFEAFKTETNTTDADYEDVSGGGTATGDVTLDTAQTITGIKTFENGIKNNLIEVNGNALVMKNSVGNGSTYFKIEQVYKSGYKNWFGLNFIRTTGTTQENLAVMEVRQDDYLYIVSTVGLTLNSNSIELKGPVSINGATTITGATTINGDTSIIGILNMNGRYIANLASPITDSHAATKKYVDDNVLLKQNKLTAGTNITITGDVISSTGGGGGGGTPSNMVTTDTAQTITGIKTFTNGIKINGATTITGATTMDSLRLNDKLTLTRGLAITGSTSITGGTLNMGSRKIMDLGAPTLDADATTKKYVDTEIAKALKPYKEFMDTLMKNKGENYDK